MITRLTFWREVDTAVHPRGHKIRVRLNKSARGFALQIRLFVIDVSAGKVKIVTRLGKTIYFLQIWRNRLEQVVRERSTDQFANGLLEVRQQKIKLVPCRLLSTLLNPPATSLTRDFDSLRKSISYIEFPVPQSVVSIQFVDHGDDERCLRIIDRFKLMNMRQILMTKKLKMNTSRACQESVHYPIRGGAVSACVRLNM